MKYRLLGRSGLRVSEVCLGTANLGWGGSNDANEAESVRILEAFAEAGGNFVDTSNRYSRGNSERHVGKFLSSSREKFVLASKYTLSTSSRDPNASGNHRKSLVRALEDSLRRLGTDYVDVYMVHAWDSTIPVQEMMRSLEYLVQAGKVLHVGISNAPAWIVSQANTVAELRGWSPFVNVQVEYSLVQREPERDLLPMARELSIGVTAYSPLGGGWLTGRRYASRDNPPEGADRLAKVGSEADVRNARIADEVSSVANEIGCPASRVALAWVRRQEPGIIPIVGAEKEEQIRENLAFSEVHLSKEHYERLEEASRIDLGYPHDFLAREDTRERVYGDLRECLDFGPPV